MFKMTYYLHNLLHFIFFQGPSTFSKNYDLKNSIKTLIEILGNFNLERFSVTDCQAYLPLIHAIVWLLNTLY
jgi:hypothetical protein